MINRSTKYIPLSFSFAAFTKHDYEFQHFVIHMDLRGKKIVFILQVLIPKIGPIYFYILPGQHY